MIAPKEPETDSLIGITKFAVRQNGTLRGMKSPPQSPELTPSLTAAEKSARRKVNARSMTLDRSSAKLDRELYNQSDESDSVFRFSPQVVSKRKSIAYKHSPVESEGTPIEEPKPVFEDPVVTPKKQRRKKEGSFYETDGGSGSLSLRPRTRSSKLVLEIKPIEVKPRTPKTTKVEPLEEPLEKIEQPKETKPKSAKQDDVEEKLPPQDSPTHNASEPNGNAEPAPISPTQEEPNDERVDTPEVLPPLEPVDDEPVPTSSKPSKHNDLEAKPIPRGYGTMPHKKHNDIASKKPSVLQLKSFWEQLQHKEKDVAVESR